MAMRGLMKGDRDGTAEETSFKDAAQQETGELETLRPDQHFLQPLRPGQAASPGLYALWSLQGRRGPSSQRVTTASGELSLQ